MDRGEGVSGYLEAIERVQYGPAASKPDHLERIAVALERIATVLEGFEPVTKEPCLHPIEDRKDFSVMGKERWQCKCGYSVGCEGMVL